MWLYLDQISKSLFMSKCRNKAIFGRFLSVDWSLCTAEEMKLFDMWSRARASSRVCAFPLLKVYSMCRSAHSFILSVPAGEIKKQSQCFLLELETISLQWPLFVLGFCNLPSSGTWKEWQRNIRRTTLWVGNVPCPSSEVIQRKGFYMLHDMF